MTTPRIKRVLTLGQAQINVMTDRTARFVLGPCNSTHLLYSAPMDKVEGFVKLLDHYGLKVADVKTIWASPWVAQTLQIDPDNFHGLTNLILRRMGERTKVGWVDHSPFSYDRSRAAEKAQRVIARIQRASCACT